MQAADWAEPLRATIAFRLDGDAVDPSRVRTDGQGRMRAEPFLVMMNGEPDVAVFVVPAWRSGRAGGSSSTPARSRAWATSLARAR
jgi:hypothetical protein